MSEHRALAGGAVHDPDELEEAVLERDARCGGARDVIKVARW